MYLVKNQNKNKKQKKRKERSSSKVETGVEEESEEPRAKREKKERPKGGGRNLPNKTLFIQNLPEDCTDGQLIAIFQPYPGFREVRLVPGKKGWSFVEFQNEQQSGVALDELQGYMVDSQHGMQISFQKRQS